MTEQTSDFKGLFIENLKKFYLYLVALFFIPIILQWVFGADSIANSFIFYIFQTAILYAAVIAIYTFFGDKIKAAMSPASKDGDGK
ncbi:hypothetical protein [Roseospirillum parvum]|uniref:Uncharacterized protein n=1 Tax=Roseospirillum parvum TaxID=83401 RepID=A0A1G7V2I0_9PROT|nr:hypothetical protein [Roseospirillum parvum]SDG53966.1 hypothetical protein SAMN05421742_101516 [Roseospirillum parvum]